MSRTTLRAALASLLLLAAASARAGATTDTVVATYTSGTVTAFQAASILRAEGERRDPYALFLSATDDGDRTDAAFWLDRAIRDVVWTRHWAPVAEAAGTTVPEPVLAEAELMRGELAMAFWEDQQPPLTTITLEQARPIAARLAQEMNREEAREVSYIFREVAPNAPEARAREVHEQLMRLHADIVAGRVSFADAARRHSEAATAAKGGRIGYVRRGDTYNPQFIELVYATPVGGYSPVTKLRNGFYIVHVGHAIEPVRVTADDIATSPAMQARLLADAQGVERARVLEELRARHGAATPAAAVLAELRARGALPSQCDEAADLATARGRAMAYHRERSHDRETTVTEREILNYYETMKAGYVEEGIFRLTRFAVPVRPGPSSRVASFDDAAKAAAAALDKLRAGATPEQVRRTLGAGVEFVWETNDKWLRGSGVGPADFELLKIRPGGFSGIHRHDEGAVFFRLDDRREPPRIPLDKVRDDIVRRLTSANRRVAMMDEQDDLLRRLDLKLVWRERHNYPLPQAD